MSEGANLMIIEEKEIRGIIREELRTVLKANLDIIPLVEKNPNLQDLLIPLNELPKIFKVDRVTIDNWEKNNILPNRQKRGGKVYFFRKDIEEFIFGENNLKVA
jgi:hypothetical protein